MGIRAVLGSAFKPAAVVTAADTYYQPSGNSIWGGYDDIVTISRKAAMQVPAVARARNIICSTIGSLPLHRYSAIDGKELSGIPLLDQPDIASPKSVTFSWLADSIFFYGVGYCIVTAVYSEDKRPAGMRWIDPSRVQPILNNAQTMVVGYQLDGVQVPETGVGSLIAFNGVDEGLLKRAGRTIETALELEKAAFRAAQEPSPQSVLKSSLDLPDEKVTSLLTKWKEARQTRATAYLPSTLELDTIGFDAKSQQLVEARQFHASELARACGIPAWYLNAEMATMTYSNTETERRSLIDFSLRPLLSAIEDRLSMADVTARAVRVRFDLDDFLRGSMKERSEIAVSLYQAGIVDLTAAQEIVGLDTAEAEPQGDPVG